MVGNLLLLTVRCNIFGLILDLILFNDQIHDSFGYITLIFRRTLFVLILVLFSQLNIFLSVAIFIYV